MAILARHSHPSFSTSSEKILQVLPDTRNVVILVGASPVEKFWREVIGREMGSLADRVTFLWTDPLSFEDILEHAATLPPKTAIFSASMIVTRPASATKATRRRLDFTRRERAGLFL